MGIPASPFGRADLNITVFGYRLSLLSRENSEILRAERCSIDKNTAAVYVFSTKGSPWKSRAIEGH